MYFSSFVRSLVYEFFLHILLGKKVKEILPWFIFFTEKMGKFISLALTQTRQVGENFIDGAR